jgi:hypothetical protein
MEKPHSNKNLRYFEIIFFVVIWTLIVCSLIALALIHLKMFYSPNYKFSFSLESIGGYLNIYGEYGGLFKATIATIVAFLGLQRLKVAIEANADKRKQDYFIEWKTVMDTRLNEIDEIEPQLRREFITLRQGLYSEIHGFDFKLKNKQQLTKIFENHFNSRISYFEEMSKKYFNTGGFYPSNKYSYAGQNFIFILSACFQSRYDNFYQDALDLYQENLPADRLIDQEAFHLAITRKP